MKLFIILAVTALCNGAKLDRTYLPPNAQTSGGSDSILLTPLSQQPLQNEPARNFPLNSFSRNNQLGAAGLGPTDQSNVYSSDVNGIQNAQYQTGFNNLGGYDDKPERAQAAFERNAAILRQSNENDGDKYSYAYETENGIYAEENGVATNGVEAEGGFTYTGDDGKVYTIRYTADQNGFVPQGEHLPTPPPVPEEILKALEENARDEAAGIYDDGTYNEAKYANEDTQGYDFNANNNQYSNANNQINTDAIVVNSANPSGPRTSFGTPVASSITPGFGRTTNYGYTAPDFNSAADFGKTSRTYENRNPVPSFASKNLSSGNNAPSFGLNSPSSVPSSLSFNSNTLAVATPNFGRSGPAASPVYGPPTAPGISTTGFSRTAPPSENNAPTFGQRTVGISAASDNIRGDVEKAYLPPFQKQTNQNGRTQSFNEKDGYRY